MSRLEERIQDFTKSQKQKLKIFGSKSLGINITRRATEEERKNSKQRTLFGIEFYCESCKKLSFADLIDPWSYNSHARCGGCMLRVDFNPNDAGIGISFAYIEICWSIAKEKHSNAKRQKTMFLQLFFLGLSADCIPPDRNGATLADLESMTVISKMMYIMLMR